MIPQAERVRADLVEADVDPDAFWIDYLDHRLAGDDGRSRVCITQDDQSGNRGDQAQTAPLRERQADGSRHPFDSFIVAKTPAARWGTPEDLMGPVVFLASDASNFVNGHILYVDGGILAYIGKQP